MKLTIFTSQEDQAQGLLRFQKVPADTLYLFPRVRNNVLTTVGMHEPIRVALLDANLNFVPLSFYLEAIFEPGRTIILPPETRHAIEASEHTSIMQALANTALWRKVKAAVA